ncbi:hypothetical protein K3495_g5946 [Podosphaera aphanis]|nr:hypothetical protein K3495_g5946 [Podosphaera aphanis]
MQCQFQIFLNPIEEDQGAILELDNNQIIETVQVPEEEEEELIEETTQLSRAENLKSQVSRNSDISSRYLQGENFGCLQAPKTYPE